MRRGLSIVGILFVLLCIPIISYAQGTKPVAKFNFEKEAYQESEPISAVDESYSPQGLKIVKRQWKVMINGKEKTSANLPSLLKNTKVGQVTVYLRVKDSNGTWSEWVSKNLTIKEAVPFKINSFTSEKTTYGIGEKLQLTYTYSNPNDLEIKAQRWRYKNLSTNGSNISSKPKYFKKAGLYEISLEIQDEWGNWSNKVSCKVNVSNEIIERNGYYLFEKGKQGDLIDGYIDKDYNSFNEANIVSVVDVPGTLMMSNSPESIYSSGILYKDTTSGVGRLLVHHQNRTQYAKKLMIIVSTPEEQPVTLKISNKAIVGPNKHILQTGQRAVSQYLNGSLAQTYTVKPGETLCIYNSASVKSWKSEEVVSGTLDFESSGKVTWQVVAMDEQSSLENLSKLSVLDRDVHNRGTFNVIERQYTLDLSNITESAKLVLGREQEEWLQGKDALTGDVMWNKGNYGLPIKITITNNEDIGVIANARGGNILGALKWNKTKVFNIPNEDILSSKTVAALVGNIKANTTNEIVYMLPNGSSAPILFGFIPKSLWK
ncbi:MAG: hypothetical protein E7231_10160 [Cellulosilyticum sp.]|nr:hypothetical protein [Cellulosilyticum sp.]